MGFADCLATGRKAELRVGIVLLSAGFTVRQLPGGRVRGADLTVEHPASRLPFRLEVKCEDNHKGTGNLAVETQQGKRERKLSGLSLSTADITVHTLGERVVVYDTHAMRLHIAEREYRQIPFRLADNGNCGVLVPIADVEQQAWCDHCEIEELPESKVWQFDCQAHEVMT